MITDLELLRRYFAEELRFTAPIRSTPALVEAFMRVPRERHVGPPPWQVVATAGGKKAIAFEISGANPGDLYHDVLVSIDTQRQLNNGQPSLWARLFDQLQLKPGLRVLHVGAGMGYYSAILAEVVGPEGCVYAVEIDEGLSADARHRLREYPQVEVIEGDGSLFDPGPVDRIIVSAGVTHPAEIWLERLTDHGGLLMPLTADTQNGIFLKVRRQDGRYAAVALERIGIFSCLGNGRDLQAAAALRRALARQQERLPRLRALHRGDPPSGESACWYRGPGFWLEGDVPITFA